MKFFDPNIGGAGRIARAIFGLVCLVAGLLLLHTSLVASLLLFVSAGFGFYEAVRGWCFLRACGIKTKL